MNLYVRYNTERDRKQRVSWIQERDRKQRVSWIQQTSRRQATEQVPLHPPRGSTPQAGRVRLPPGTIAGQLCWLGRAPATGDASWLPCTSSTQGCATPATGDDSIGWATRLSLSLQRGAIAGYDFAGQALSLP